MLATSSPWIEHYQPNPRATTRLFCFPFAGGNAQNYHSWTRGLPSAIDVCAIELPGRGSRFQEAPYKDLQSLLASMAEALVPYLDLPFAFFGHSMGSTIAFELARSLRREYGWTPTHLFVSGRNAPQIKSDLETIPVHTLPHGQFLDKLKVLSGTPESVLQNPEMLELIVPTLRADLELIETYKYSIEAPLECPITAFGGLQDPLTRRFDLEAWGEQTSDRFAVHMFSGDHFFINSARSKMLRIIARSV